MRAARASAVVIALGLALANVGCSKGSTSPTGAGGAAPATTAASVASTAPAGATSPTQAAAGGSDAAFCAARNIANPALDPDNPDPASQIASLQKAVALAPPEIKPDVQTIADTDIPIFQGRVPKDQIEQRVGDPKVLAALRNIARWSADHCK